MTDPLARFNMMGYPEGRGLNWHFDRSQFTTTLLLQAPLAGGDFVYRSDLRTDDDPNYDGVATPLKDQAPGVKSFRAKAGTLNVFKGKTWRMGWHRLSAMSPGSSRYSHIMTGPT